MEKIQSTCNYCSLACNMDFYVEDGKIQKVIPTATYPVNKGFSCIKGLNLDKQQTVAHVTKIPRVKREDGTMENVSWDEAFTTFAHRIKEIQEKYGKESVAGISTGQLTLEEMALVGHIMRGFLGANLDGNTRLCMATSVVAHKQSFGFDAPPYTLDDFEHSDTIILIGANPIVTHPIIWSRIGMNKNPNKKVIVIDPRRSETAQKSDYWYGIKPKSDISLFYMIANILIEKDWVDKKYIDEHTENFENFKEHVSKFKLEDAEELTGLTPEKVMELVEMIHNGKAVSFWWTMGINQGYQAVRNAQSIINLALMTGNMGRPGTGGNSITGQCNAMGSRVFSNTAGLYGGGDYDNPVRREKVAQALGIDESWLPTKPTIPYSAIIEKINSGEIKALWIMCTNPRHSWINNDTFAEAMKKLELFVVQDLYGDTDSSKNCHVYFPVVSGIEKEGTIINTERRLSRVTKVVDKPEGMLSDYEVFLGVGKALGMGDLLKGWETPESCFELMKKCSAGTPCDITGVDYQALVGTCGVQWPFKKGDVLMVQERRLFEDGKYYTPSGRAKFMFEDVLENPVPTNAEFPYVLNTGRGTVGQWHTQTRTREISYVEGVAPKDAYIYINDELAKKMDIKKNEKINVKSINGQERIFIAIPTGNVPMDQLYAPLHYIETNALTLSIYDTYSKEPSYKYAPVNISKLV